MDQKERIAFAKSYAGNVAHCSYDEVMGFINKRYDATGDIEQELYDEYDCYSSIIDSLCIWTESQQFLEAQQNPTTFLGRLKRLFKG